MQEPRFVKDYKHDEVLRKSFSELAHSTFEISFEEWYRKGFWNERYMPYSFAQGDQVVANVSVNQLDLVIDGDKKSAIQIGTVMTHPDYRGQGLSTSLMNKVIEDYEHQYDVMYLFANDSVLDFYPKFGFKAVEEHLFTMDFTPSELEPTGIRKLNVSRAEDLHLIYQFVSERLPVSKRLGTDHTQGIFMFYGLNVFREDMYYLEEENVIVVYKKENHHMDIFDMVHTQEIHTQDILTKIAGRDTKKITFHYTPDDPDLVLNKASYPGGLFVRTNGDHHYPVHVKHPMTSTA
ncbi:GNAT family N-acetyltransferase [Paenibacillus terrigena]|uniref:GNAT family N-acetyltransferase n=1 Tax=Paenibacillus terrigena TaxID=369333 RepID=UPI0028D7B7F1|nr:GNAT family N-acetyltransferase [Paenibacillus terrigena]